MAVTNQWSLFGLDLGRVADKCRLGVNQLLWGDEAGLRNRFYPHTYTTSEGAASLDPYAKLTSVRCRARETAGGINFPVGPDSHKIVATSFRGRGGS